MSASWAYTACGAFLFVVTRVEMDAATISALLLGATGLATAVITAITSVNKDAITALRNENEELRKQRTEDAAYMNGRIEALETEIKELEKELADERKARRALEKRQQRLEDAE